GGDRPGPAPEPGAGGEPPGPEPAATAKNDWRQRPVTRPRPGHADLSGALKYDVEDARNILERASARETAMRVAVGAACRRLLAEFGIVICSHVVRLGPVAAPRDPDALPPEPGAFADVDESPVRCLDPEASAAMVRAIDQARERGETLGGIYEVIAWGVPPGLGSHVQWDRKLDGRIAQALMSIQATKGVEFGLGFETASRFGSRAHDPILYSEAAGIHRSTGRSGGVEGGMTTGQPLVVRVAMKPLATLYNPLPSIDLSTLEPVRASIERSDVTAVPAAAVVGEAAVAFELARAMLEKFGGDSLSEIRRNFEAYARRLAERGMHAWQMRGDHP
ncbi:MAG: chorismate synthase, partial [Firmicutes bacterium]|nr:chorismate synthase [Bacillota bacterium]